MTTVRNIAAGVRSMTSNAFLVDGDRPVLVDAGDGFDAVDRIEAATGGIDAVVLTHTHPDHALVDHAIADGETVRMGDDAFEALHTPGHKDDHLCFYSRGGGVLFAGDLVFASGGFGRTDLPEGDRATLVDSIEYLLETVDGSLSAMYVGHGPAVEANPQYHIELAAQAARMG